MPCPGRRGSLGSPLGCCLGVAPSAGTRPRRTAPRPPMTNGELRICFARACHWLACHEVLSQANQRLHASAGSGSWYVLGYMTQEDPPRLPAQRRAVGPPTVRAQDKGKNDERQVQARIPSLAGRLKLPTPKQPCHGPLNQSGCLRLPAGGRCAFFGIRTLGGSMGMTPSADRRRVA